jgi:hypothetical protein
MIGFDLGKDQIAELIGPSGRPASLAKFLAGSFFNTDSSDLRLSALNQSVTLR